MARVTVEDCLRQVSNRFALVHIASKRCKQIMKGSNPLIRTKDNKAAVTALREVASSKVGLSKELNLERIEDE